MTIQPGYIRFPSTTGNYAAVARTAPVDPNLDWRADFVRPANPTNNATFHTITGVPFWLFIYNSVGTIYVYAQMYFTDLSVIQSTFALPVGGFPAVGARVQLRGKWDSVANTLTLYWRPSTADLLDDVNPWTLGATNGPIVKAALELTYWQFSDTPQTQSAACDVYRAVLIQNGAVHIDVNPTVDLIGVDVDAPTFEATTGQTVTVTRAGTPAVELVSFDIVPNIHVTEPTPPWRIDFCSGWVRLATSTAYEFHGTARRNTTGEFTLTTSPAGIPPAGQLAAFDPRDVDTIRLVAGKRILFPGIVRGPNDGDSGFYVDQSDDGTVWRFEGVDAWQYLADGIALPDPTKESAWLVSHDTRTGIASSVLAAYIENNIGQLATVEGKVPNLQVADEFVGDSVQFSARFDQLDDLARRIAAAGAFEVLPEVSFTGVITIRLSAARDLSPILVFSDKGDLLTSRARFQQRGANWVCAGGDGAGTSRIFRTASTGATPRRRKFIDVSSATTADEVQAAATAELALNAERYAVTSELSAAVAQIAITQGLRLGDKLGISINGRRYTLPIEAVTLDVSAGEQKMTPQFGDAIPDALARLLRKLDKPDTVSGVA